MGAGPLSAPAQADPAAVSKSPGAIVTSLPRAFYGLFMWRMGGAGQAVEIKIIDVADSGAGIITANGVGAYTSETGVTTVRFAISISADTLQVRIREYQPSGSDEFITGGQHIGRISADLRRVDAEWTTEADGSKGDLILIGLRKDAPIQHANKEWFFNSQQRVKPIINCR